MQIKEDKKKAGFYGVPSSDDQTGHIMISYQWDSQKLMLKVSILRWRLELVFRDQRLNHTETYIFLD